MPPDDDSLLPLQMLATRVAVHLRTLRSAARTGRLAVTSDHRTTFRQLRARATLAEARRFRAHCYGRRGLTHVSNRIPSWSAIPPDYPTYIRDLRRDLGLSQSQLAARIGAANRAVVYQWESMKRCPSPLFWDRIKQLRLGWS
jgi:ribosome-binding protein aMBF1 (putative translation factor)